MPITVNLNAWKGISQVTLDLHTEISERDEGLLHYVWRRITGYNRLKLIFNTGVFVSNGVYRILQNIPNKISKLIIDATNCSTAPQCKLINLIQRILSQLKSPKHLAIRLMGTYVPDNNLKTIFQDILIKTAHLKVFILKIDCEDLADEHFINIFKRMPNLAHFTLELPGTQITDKTLGLCTNNILSLSEKLQSISLDISGTEITEFGMQNILANIPPVKSIILNLSDTKITDQTLQLFSHLDPRLETLDIDLTYTEIRDASIEFLITEKLLLLTKLKHFQISVSNSNVSKKIENKLEALLKNFKNI